MVVRAEDGTKMIHLSEISSIILQTERVYVSAYLLAELAKHKISFVVSDEKRNPIGQYLPLYGSHNCSKRTVEQLAWGEPIKKRVWQRIVREKIRQQASVLSGFELPEAAQLKAMSDDVRSGDVTNREACAARIYFRALFGEGFSRDVDCAVNDALNYGYAVLLSLVNREIVSRGYLTQTGICHRSEYNQFNLACDFMEPFRPVVDREVCSWAGAEFGVEQRRLLSGLPSSLVGYRNGSYKLSSAVSLFVQDCLNALNKQAPLESIVGFELQ